jgi:hypothetical protein
MASNSLCTSDYDCHVASTEDYAKCPESPIPLEIDSGVELDNVDYVAREFASCLQNIENSFVNRDSILERSIIYLGKFRTLYAYMLLPPTEFNDVDTALGKLFECTFPAEAGRPAGPAGREEYELQLFIACEKELVEALHKNEYICNAHKCTLPDHWNSQIEYVQNERPLQFLEESSNACSGTKPEVAAVDNSRQEPSNTEPSGSEGASVVQRQPGPDSHIAYLITNKVHGKQLYCYACKSMVTCVFGEPIEYRCPVCARGVLSKSFGPLSFDCYM